MRAGVGAVGGVEAVRKDWGELGNARVRLDGGWKGIEEVKDSWTRIGEVGEAVRGLEKIGVHGSRQEELNQDWRRSRRGYEGAGED